MKSLIVNAPTLAIPNPNQTFEVEMDASDYALGLHYFKLGDLLPLKTKNWIQPKEITRFKKKNYLLSFMP